MAGALAVYVGTKQDSGTEADKAGLTNGVLKFVSVSGNSAEIADGTTRSTNIASGTAFTLSSVASTAFSRPEDGAWNPLNPNEYYFVTTDRLDQASDGVGSQVGRSRLWRLTFADITNPDAGGTIDLLIDGDTVDGAKVNMLDNLTIDRNGRILLQEDTGGAAHNAKIWQYDIATDTATMLAEHDPARFGDIGVPATAPFTTDEESSGIIDAQDVLGPGWFLLTVMAHYPRAAHWSRAANFWRSTTPLGRPPDSADCAGLRHAIALVACMSAHSRRARGLEAEVVQDRQRDGRAPVGQILHRARAEERDRDTGEHGGRVPAGGPACRRPWRRCRRCSGCDQPAAGRSTAPARRPGSDRRW